MILVRIFGRGMPIVIPASTSLRSTRLTAWIVFSSSGKNAAYATMKSDGAVPVPNHRIAIGSSAIGAIGRNDSMIGSRLCLSVI